MNIGVRSNIGNCVGGDWLSESVTLANRVSGAWRTWPGTGSVHNKPSGNGFSAFTASPRAGKNLLERGFIHNNMPGVVR